MLRLQELQGRRFRLESGKTELSDNHKRSRLVLLPRCPLVKRLAAYVKFVHRHREGPPLPRTVLFAMQHFFDTVFGRSHDDPSPFRGGGTRRHAAPLVKPKRTA